MSAESIEDFEFKRGYTAALQAAIKEINIELRWQTELQMRGDKHASVVCDRLIVLKNIYSMFSGG